MIESVYKSAFSIWNQLIDLAITLFTTSPTTANGSVYVTAYNLYLAIQSISTPIAIVFFLIAIFKDVITTPPDQQARRFFGDAMKFGIMIGLLTNLWSIMGYIIQIADGVTTALNTSGATYQMSVSSELSSVIAEAGVQPGTFSVGNWVDYIFTNILFFIAAIGTLAVIISSCVSILSSAFQRIIKPLAILPFSSITVAMGAGSGDASRVMSSYLKTFFGFCISGAFMVICVKLGVSLTSGMIAFDINSLTLHEKVIFISVQTAITPIIIAGLVKSADSIIGRFF